MFFRPTATWHNEWFRPSTDLVQEDGDGVKLQLDLPGVKREDINIEVESGVLTISSTRTNPTKQEEQNQRFRLNRTLDPENITAQLQDGVLTVLLSKRSEAQPRKIEIS